MLKGVRILFGAAMAYLEHLKSKLDEVHDLGKDSLITHFSDPVHDFRLGPEDRGSKQSEIFRRRGVLLPQL